MRRGSLRGRVLQFCERDAEKVAHPLSLAAAGSEWVHGIAPAITSPAGERSWRTKPTLNVKEQRDRKDLIPG